MRIYPLAGDPPLALRLWSGTTAPSRVGFAPDGRHLITNNPNGTADVLRLAGP